jgi:hypothetical protein
MKNKITRTLFWFNDENGEIRHLNNIFFGLGTLLNNKINEKYTGKKIQFINIEFASKEYYNKYPVLAIDYVHYYGSGSGHLKYYGLIDFNSFNKLNATEKKYYIWNRACDYLKKSAKQIGNKELLQAVDFAHDEGIKIELNTDYKVIEKDFVHDGLPMNTELWILFRDSGMNSKFKLKEKGDIIFEMKLDDTVHGNEYFLEMYKKIEYDGKNIIIKGSRDIDYLPLKIDIEKKIII